MILPVATAPTVRRCRLLPLFRRLIYKSGFDVYESVSKEKFRFKALKLKIFEKLYNTKFAFSGKDYGEYTYTTFAFKKFRRKPVEIVIKPENMDIATEEYGFYDSHRIEKMIGDRSFRRVENSENIESGNMNSYKKWKYAGIGVREHQIAIERMFALGKKNIEIYALPKAYKFHKSCGFVPIPKYESVDIFKFSNLVKDYAKEMHMTYEQVKKMMVFKYDKNSGVLVDYNSTYANFLDYVYSHRKRYPKIPEYSVDMKLSEEAIEEWKKIIEKQPILIDKKIPKYWPESKR